MTPPPPPPPPPPAFDFISLLPRVSYTSSPMQIRKEAKQSSWRRCCKDAGALAIWKLSEFCIILMGFELVQTSRQQDSLDVGQSLLKTQAHREISLVRKSRGCLKEWSTPEFWWISKCRRSEKDHWFTVSDRKPTAPFFLNKKKEEEKLLFIDWLILLISG